MNSLKRKTDSKPDSPAAAAGVIAVIGGGPAGLMAAEVLAGAGLQVELYDRMASVGRKFLLAGKGGLNLTHSEPPAAFEARFGARRETVAAWLHEFDANALRAWANDLGIGTFVGSSGRVFPTDMKAAPLLRAWLHRLRAAGVQFHMRHRWQGVEADGRQLRLRFETAGGKVERRCDAAVLALGGASWPRLGSDGTWSVLLAERGIPVSPLRPANCGFDAAWSAHFRERHAGQPVKNVGITFTDAGGTVVAREGEFMVTAHGIEGSLVYALSAPMRERIERDGFASIALDLAPARSAEQLRTAIAHPRGSRSMSSHLQSRAGITGVRAGLLRELASAQTYADPALLAGAIKRLPLRLTGTRPIAEAISSAGGVMLEGLSPGLMAKSVPGLFLCGEMLDWEAPTGGYLLTASMASGRWAARGVLDWLGGSS
jgi:uncharacterized flavoprotein (TIGR03862 family)